MPNLDTSLQQKLSEVLLKQFPWLRGIKRNGECGANYEEPCGSDVISELCEFYTQLRKGGN